MAHWKSLLLIYFVFSFLADSTPGKSFTSAQKMETESTEMANLLNNFGLKLTGQLLNENNNTNVVLSPVGVTGLLAMVLLGSVGRSYDELSDNLGFSQDILTNRRHHEQFGHFLEDLNNNETYSKTVYADAIFVDKNYKLRDMYQSYLKKVYHGDAINVDFKDSTSAKSSINQWVSDNTNGILSDFLKDELPAETKVVLLSALYFSGQWKVPFLPEHTKELPFTTPSGDKVMVDQMLNIGQFKFGFSKDDGFEILAFPYNDSLTTLYAIKPRFPQDTNIFTLMNSLDYTKINNVIEQMKEKECLIRFPKMNLQSNTRLESSLKALGIKSIFSSEDANFALMLDNNFSANDTEDDTLQRINDSDKDDTQLRNIINGLPNPGVHVDSVIHSVKIKIDEFGTEATAASGAILARTVHLFYLNTPFYIFIRNEKTHLVTFSAVVLDPSNPF